MSTDASAEPPPFGPGVRLLVRHPSGLIALEKPSGILSHPNSEEDTNRSLFTARYDTQRECYCWTQPVEGRTRPRTLRWFLLHRLDSATSGIILLADTPEIAALMKASFAERRIHKIYLARVFGRPTKDRETWRDLLETSHTQGVARTRAGSGVPAETAMELKEGRDSAAGWTSQLQLEPLTGRTHQLRVQCARRNLPIIGDQTYGDFAANRRFQKAGGDRRLHLHAHRVEVDTAGITFSATSPLPWS